ncbi:MAG: PAS domain S-box protein [Alphaproteobacteria bacterium]|nr:PAS domain S-box protein [Alphaproteobacteria bacterium]
MNKNSVLDELAVDRYRLLVESVTDYAIYMLDPKGIISSWNPGAERFKGYTAGEVIGSHFSRFFTEEDLRERLPDRILETAAREGRFEGQGWRVRKDGRRFWAHVVVDAIRGQDGALMGFAKIVRDLSDQRATDTALHDSEERFRLLVQSVTDYAIYMLDAEGRVTNWNAGARRIKQYAADEIIGQHFSKFYTEEDREAGEPAKALAAALSEGRFEKEGWRVRKDGSRFWANVIIDPIHDESGKLIGFAKVTRDITERLESQQALEVAREAFFQSQKVEAIGMLTGGIAHDFNNLLSVVLGSLELLRKRIDDPASLQLIENAAQGARRGVSLTQRMLAFARRQDLKVEPVDVPALVSGMADILKRTLGPEVTVSLDFPERLPAILTDANQLELAFLNLAVNARDAMPEGGEITLSARAKTVAEGAGQDLAPGAYVCLSVADTGEGMDEETLKSAAEPFFTTKGVGKGTGLGLPMVKGLAEQLDGRMVISSEVGKGTRVELWLPAASGEPSAATTTPREAEPAEDASAALRVLAVDDDPLILMNLVAMLEDMGHSVLEASSGKEALALLDSATVDLIITDHAMPNMTGAQMAAQVRATQPDLPIVLATGYAALPANAEIDLPRLPKPYSQADLARAISRVMSPA